MRFPKWVVARRGYDAEFHTWYVLDTSGILYNQDFFFFFFMEAPARESFQILCTFRSLVMWKKKCYYMEEHGNNMLKFVAHAVFYDHLITVFVW